MKNLDMKNSDMKKLGLCLIIVGAIWGLIAFNINVSVKTESTTIGSGRYSTHIPSENVHNFSLADQRRNHLSGAGIALLSGVLFFCFGSIKPAEGIVQTQKNTASETQTIERKCPFCAEFIKQEAVVCRFCNRDVPVLVEPVLVEPVLVEPAVETSAAEKFLNSIKDEDKAIYENYSLQTEKERKAECFACHGEDSACGMCDSREANLKKYLEAKRAIETATI